MAIGIIKRLGLGRVRHLAVADLWVQQKLRLGIFTVAKWPSLENPADLMTKGKSRDETMKFMEKMKIRKLPGRSAASPDAETTWSRRLLRPRLPRSKLIESE